MMVKRMNKHTSLLGKTLAIIYPFILIIGFYVILNSVKSPGGGFQGGGILSALYVIGYMTKVQERSVKRLEMMEKYILLLIVVLLIGFMNFGLNIKYSFLNPYYLVLANVFIGLEVFLSFGIIFYRFLYSEGNND